MSYTKKRLLIGTTAAVALLMSVSANAQTAQEDEIVVTGIKSSLKKSLDFKRDSSQVVDAITAEDVGKFPDGNIAEALQRITGVAIDRNGGDGQFITVRGLGPEFNQVLINGRTMATDNAGRQFSFDLISADIISRAEVFKTSTPNLQSGGIGAVVNIATARPLERPGTNASFQASGTYDTLRDEISPEISGVASWTNENNTAGIVVGAAYQDRSSQIDSAQTGGFPLADGGSAVFAPESSTGLTAASLGTVAAGRVQQQAIYDRELQDRERITLNSTVQFRPSDDLEITIDGLYSKLKIDSNATEFSGFFGSPYIDPQIDANGTVVSFSRPGVDFATRNPLIAGDVGLSQNDPVLIQNNRNSDSYQIGGNIDWQASEDFALNLDVSTSKASEFHYRPFVVLGAFAQTSPTIALPHDDGIPTFTNFSELTNTSLSRLHFTDVRSEDVDDEIFEVKLSGDWDLDMGPLETVSAGGLISDRTKSEQRGRSPRRCTYCGYNTPYDTSILQPFALNDFLSGVPGSDQIPVNFWNATIEDAFRVHNDPSAYTNRVRAAGLSDAEFAASVADIEQRIASGHPIWGLYTPENLPGSSFVVDENINSIFMNTEWSGDFGGDLPWSGNIGFRFAQTDTTSFGVDQPVNGFNVTPGDTLLIPDLGASTPVAIENSYTNFLPSANIKLEIAEDKALRFAVSKTVTRPTLTALGTGNSFGGRSFAPISSGGNPNLEAFEATNYDASFEWYFDEGVGFFGVTAFHKELGNFIEAQTLPVIRTITLEDGSTQDVPFQDTRQRNGQSGSISGAEFALQKSLENGFGAGVNYTYVTSEIDRENSSMASDCGYNGLSPHSVNANVFYEKNAIQARVAYNWRDEFLFQCFAQASEPQTREAFGQLDFSAAYAINDAFQVFAEGINLLGEDTRDYSRFRNRLIKYERTGTRLRLGVRGSF